MGIEQTDTMIAFGGNLKTHRDGDVGMVEGLGVMYGNPAQKDLMGDYFTPNTWYGHAAGDMSSATLNHGIPMYGKNTKATEAEILEGYAKRQFKSPIRTEETDIGILARHALDLKDEYEAWVFEQTQNGTFKWSSGALSHLVDRDDDTGEIKRWEIGEFAYTPSPAEYRLPAITPLKSYHASFMDDRTTAAETIQETTQETAAPAVAVVSDGNGATETKHINEVDIMSEQDTEQTAPALTLEDISGAMTSAVKAAVDPLKAEIEALKAKPVVDVGISDSAKTVNIVGADAIGNSYENAFKAYIGSRGKISNLRALEEGVDSEGGYLVPDDWESAIAFQRDSASVLSQLPVQNRTTNRLVYRWPTESTAYVAATATAEEIAYDQTDPAFGEATFTMQKYTRLTIVSDELFDDEDAQLQSALSSMLGRAHALAENALLVTRLEAATLTSLTLDSNSGITAAEIPELYYLLPDGYDFNGWLMRKATEGVIRGLTGSDFHFIPNPQGNGMNLWGAPVVTASAVDAIATTTNSIFGGDWTNGVGVVRNGSFSISINPYLYEATGQVGVFSRQRLDIQTLQGLAIVEGVHPV